MNVRLKRNNFLKKFIKIIIYFFQSSIIVPIGRLPWIKNNATLYEIKLIFDGFDEPLKDKMIADKYGGIYNF